VISDAAQPETKKMRAMLSRSVAPASHLGVGGDVPPQGLPALARSLDLESAARVGGLVI